MSTVVRGWKLGQHLQTLGPQHVIVHIGVFVILGIVLSKGFESRTSKITLLLLAALLGLATETYEHLVFVNGMESADVA